MVLLGDYQLHLKYMELEKQVALVTGGGSGIGKAIALRFAKEGAAVSVVDVDEKGGQKVVDTIKKAGGKAVFIRADTSVPDECRQAVEQTVKAFKKLTIAINNAGIGGVQAPVGDYDIAEWDKIIGVNLSGVFYGMHYQIPALLKNKKGVIVNMASVLGQVGNPLAPGYVAAKHAVVGLTQSAALAYAEKNLRINAVGPGYIQSPLLTKNLDKKALQGLKALHPMKRLGKPEEVAELVLWLCTDKASFVTGSYYNVDGGYLAQ